MEGERGSTPKSKGGWTVTVDKNLLPAFVEDNGFCEYSASSPGSELVWLTKIVE